MAGRDQLRLKEAVVRIRGITQGNPLSVFCTAALQKPNVTGNNSNPMEGEPFVTLMCGPYTENATYLWSRNGESLSEGDRVKFSEGNRTLTLLNVHRTDRGDYECEAQNPATSNRSDPFNLNVICE